MNHYAILKKAFTILFLLSIAILNAVAQSSAELSLKTATAHPMQYYISLPEKWTPSKKWPVVVVVEAAEKEFRLNAERFAEAGKHLPFVIVAPVIVSNGNHGKRDPDVYPYSKEVWDRIDREGECSFDMEGLQAVLADVKKQYNTEDKICISGFEAGAHLVWAMIFNHPEQLKAAMPVAGNYRGRCVEEKNISTDPSRTNLPVKGLYGEQDSSFGKKSMLFSQWQEAKQLAIKHGYNNISEQEVKGKGHVPMPMEVLNWFYSLYTK